MTTAAIWSIRPRESRSFTPASRAALSARAVESRSSQNVTSRPERRAEVARGARGLSLFAFGREREADDHFHDVVPGDEGKHGGDRCALLGAPRQRYQGLGDQAGGVGHRDAEAPLAPVDGEHPSRPTAVGHAGRYPCAIVA